MCSPHEQHLVTILSDLDGKLSFCLLCILDRAPEVPDSKVDVCTSNLDFFKMVNSETPLQDGENGTEIPTAIFSPVLDSTGTRPTDRGG